VQRQPRQLVLVRHAQAEGAGPSDQERELTPAGHDAATDAGRWLAGRGVRPDHVLVSAATRTQQTWADLAGAGGWSLEPEVDPGLYAAGPDAVLDLVRALPDEVAALVLVGHNPTVGHLAQLLDDGEADPELAGEALRTGYPPCALSVFSVESPWVDLGAGTARLAGFHVGRG
jgi:phosphohistidine phosphatase